MKILFTLKPNDSYENKSYHTVHRQNKADNDFVDKRIVWMMLKITGYFFNTPA